MVIYYRILIFLGFEFSTSRISNPDRSWTWSLGAAKLSNQSHTNRIHFSAGKTFTRTRSGPKRNKSRVISKCLANLTWRTCRTLTSSMSNTKDQSEHKCWFRFKNITNSDWIFLCNHIKSKNLSWSYRCISVLFKVLTAFTFQQNKHYDSCLRCVLRVTSKL